MRKSRMLLVAVAALLVAVMASSAQAGPRSSLATSLSRSSSHPVVMGYYISVMDLLKLWKSGYRYYFD